MEKKKKKKKKKMHRFFFNLKPSDNLQNQILKEVIEN